MVASHISQSIWTIGGLTLSFKWPCCFDKYLFLLPGLLVLPRQCTPCLVDVLTSY